MRCVPPANLPTPSEIGACNGFLTNEIAAMPRLRGVLALGGTAHNAVLRVHGHREIAESHGGSRRKWMWQIITAAGRAKNAPSVKTLFPKRLVIGVRFTFTGFWFRALSQTLPAPDQEPVYNSTSVLLRTRSTFDSCRPISAKRILKT